MEVGVILRALMGLRKIIIMKNVFFRTLICILFFSLSSVYTNDILSQQTCPAGFNLPEDSNETNPLCADIDIEDGLVILNNDECNIQFSINFDVDIDVAIEDLYLDINLVDENLDYENMLCFDNIFDVFLIGGLQRGTVCGVDNTYKLDNSGPVILGEVMDGLLVRININRPSEFEDNCYHFVFELTYLDINGFSCSYFGEIQFLFQSTGVSVNVCGPLEYAGNEDNQDCEFPNGIADLEQLDNFTSSFQGTHTSECDHEMPLNHQNIFPFEGQICIPVPPGGCTEFEMTDCPSGNTNLCVNTMDALAIRRLILGLDDQTEGPYGGLLSDFNQSGGVSTFDINLLIERILDIENPETRVGECVIFDPTNDGLDGVALDGLGGWSDFSYSVEVCDGEDFEVVIGVIGDTDGSCGCDIVEGLDDGDEDEKLAFTWDENNCKLSVPQVFFYDMALDFVGDIMSVTVSDELNSIAMVNVYNRDNGYEGEEGYQGDNRYSIVINSFNAQAISLQECISHINFECTGDIEFTDKSFLIDDNIKARKLSLSSELITPRNSNQEEKIDQASFQVIDNHILIDQDDADINEFQIYTYDGILVYNQKVNSGDYVIDLSDHLSRYTRGSLFIVVGRTSSGTVVKKIIR